jgi:hypothetical protein
LQWRNIALESGRSLFLQLNAQNELRARVFGCGMVIRDGRMFPTPARSDLRFDVKMQLSQKDAHVIELGPATQCLFRQFENEWRSIIIRGYSFQRFHSRSDATLAQNNDVYFAIKALESHFINLQTDPFYVETLALLEKAAHFLKTSPDEAAAFAQNALERGRLAVLRVFPNDKMLNLLVNSLEFEIYKLKKAREPNAGSNKTWLPNQDLDRTTSV